MFRVFSRCACLRLFMENNYLAIIAIRCQYIMGESLIYYFHFSAQGSRLLGKRSEAEPQEEEQYALELFFFCVDWNWRMRWDFILSK